MGKCFHIEVRWEVVPLSGDANTIQNVCLCPSPTAAATAAAAAGAWEESAAAFNRNSVTGVTGAGDGAADCKKNKFAPMPVIKSLEEYLDDQAAGTSSNQVGHYGDTSSNQTGHYGGAGVSSGLSIMLGSAAPSDHGANTSDISAPSSPKGSFSWLRVPPSPKNSNSSGLFNLVRKKPSGTGGAGTGTSNSDSASGNGLAEEEQGRGGSKDKTATATSAAATATAVASTRGMADDNGSVGGVMESSSFSSSIGGHGSAFKYPSSASHGGDMPGSGGGGSGCVWRVYFAVRFTSSTMFRNRIERDTFDTARPLYRDMGEMAEKWLRNAGERKLMVELLPHAKSIKAGKKHGKGSGGRSLCVGHMTSRPVDVPLF